MTNQIFKDMGDASASLIKQYTEFVDELKKVYSNIPEDFHMSASEFFSLLAEYDAEGGVPDDFFEDETEGHVDIRFDELLATLGFQITEISDTGAITIEARRNYDA